MTGVHLPGVTECERVQTAWFDARAAFTGGRSWDDGALHWVASPADGGHLMFPASIDADALARGIDRIPSRPIGCWLSLEAEARADALARRGFTRGWAPWWMVAPIGDVPESSAPSDIRVELEDVPGAESLVAKAVARDLTGRWMGNAWAFVSDPSAGIFDMVVHRSRRREGIGAAMLGAVCAVASDRGATHAVLNATPDGERLYSRRGFVRVGEGITWWLHAP